MELSDNNAERAYEWLTAGEENGNRYMKLYKQNEMSDTADSRAKRNNSNDSAAIDDMVENEAPISNSSAQGAAVDKSSAQLDEKETPGILSSCAQKICTERKKCGSWIVSDI